MNLRETPAPATPPARPFLISNPFPSRLRAADISYFNPEGTDITEKTIIYTDVFAFIDILLYLVET
jgi:hypothetical protein